MAEYDIEMKAGDTFGISFKFKDSEQQPVSALGEGPFSLTATYENKTILSKNTDTSPGLTWDSTNALLTVQFTETETKDLPYNRLVEYKIKWLGSGNVKTLIEGFFDVKE